MKKIRIIAGASAAVLALGLLTACGKKQEQEPVEETPTVQEETLEAVSPEVQPEESVVEEVPLERVDEEELVEEPEEEVPAETAEVLVAELVELAEDGSMNILPYAPMDKTVAMEDPANVDFSAYEAGEEQASVTIAENALFYTVENGEMIEADETALVEGTMLVISADAEGVQTIVIYAPADEAA